MKKNIDLVYKCLDENENSVLQEIIKNKGELMQKQLNEKFGKVKSHRGLKKLEDKKMIIIKKEKKGNHIKLNEELRKEFLK